MSEFGSPEPHRIKKIAKVGTAAAVVAGLGMGISVAQEAEKGPKSEPDGIKQGGVIEIIPHPAGSEPLSFRDRSWIPDHNAASNTIPQSEVNLPEGKTAATVDHFYVKDYLLEEGYNPSKGPNSVSRGVWLVFREADGSMTRMSLSPETSEYWNVIVEGKTKPGHLDPESNFVLDNGKTLEHEAVSKVSLTPPNLAQQPQK